MTKVLDQKFVNGVMWHGFEDFVPIGTTCRVCGRDRPEGCSNTCGDSYCQEADAAINRALNMRKKTKKRAAAEKNALELINKAQIMSARIHGVEVVFDSLSEPTVDEPSNEVYIVSYEISENFGSDDGWTVEHDTYFKLSEARADVRRMAKDSKSYRKARIDSYKIDVTNVL